MSYCLSDIQTAIDTGEIDSEGNVSVAAITKIAYRYAPFFLEEYDGMPKPAMVEYEGVPVRMAPAEWIAENIDFEDIMIIFKEGFAKNQLSEVEKKSYAPPQESCEKSKSADDVKGVSAGSGDAKSASHTAMDTNV